MKRPIESARVPKTKGPYVQGIAASGGTFVFTSGLTARGLDRRIVGPGDIRAQTRRCLENVAGVIEAAGGSLADLVKMTVFLRRGEDYAGMNEVRSEMLAGVAFASSTVQASLNNPEALVEIEAVAMVPRRRAPGARGRTAKRK